jgi:hypothetical protein
LNEPSAGADNAPVDDLAQYSRLRDPDRAVAIEERPFQFRTPIVFRLAPVVPLERDRRGAHPERLRTRRFG